MRVRYRLPVLGTLRLEFSFPVRTQLFTYSFEVDENAVVTYIDATASVPDRSLWPKVTPNPHPGVRADIVLANPFFSILRRDMHAASGILALFGGVDEISLEEVEEFWEPDNPEEKEALSLLSFKRNREAKPPSEWPRVPFDLVARALIVAEHSTGFEAALNFFRKGKLDVKAEQYIDAVFDFLFMVETTYANGKFKTVQVEEEYLASSELRGLINEALRDPVLHANVRSHGRIESAFRENYLSRSPDQIIPHLVRLRGELHHHSARRSGIWHPADHIRFGADAYFLQQLCCGIAFAITEPTLFAEDAERSYQSQATASASAKALTVYRK